MTLVFSGQIKREDELIQDKCWRQNPWDFAGLAVMVSWEKLGTCLGPGASMGMLGEAHTGVSGTIRPDERQLSDMNGYQLPLGR